MADSLRKAHVLRGDTNGRQEAREGGFSLIEMLIVIVIMTVILAIALPRYDQWRRSTALQSAEGTLKDHIMQARVMAVSQNRDVAVIFAPTSYTVDASSSNPQQFKLSEYSAGLKLSSTFASNTPTTLALCSSSLPCVIFYSNGVSSITTNNDTVTVTNSGGATKTITVNVVGQVTD